MTDSKSFFWVLLVLSAAILFFRLGSYGLIETSDARYAEISAHMARSGDYVTPRLNGIKHFHKPPLTFWLTAAGFRTFGYNEWGARVLMGVAGLGTLLVTYALASRLWGRRAAYAAWLMLLGMGGFLGAHRLLTTDPFLTLSMTVALLAFWRWQERPSAPLYSHIFFLCLGLAMLTKGPVGVLVVWLVVICWALAVGRLADLAALRWGIGLAVFALVGLPWYIYVAWCNEGLLRYFVFGQLAGRISGTMGHHKYPFYYIVEMLLVFCLPWTPFLVPALTEAFRAGRGPRAGPKNPSNEGASSARAFLAAWFLVPAVFFSLPATKLPNYILPSLPAAAILLAGWWREQDVFSRGGKVAAGVLAGGFLAYGLALLVKPGIIAGMETLSGTLAPVALVVAVAYGVSALTRRPWPAFVASAAILPLVLVLAAARLEELPLKTVRPLAERMNLIRAADPEGRNARVTMYRCRIYGLPYYANQRVVEAGVERETQFEGAGVAGPLAPEELLASWNDKGRLYCVVPLERLAEFHGRRYKVLATHNKLVLISNE
ncbi:MAG: glycosyltransferase family 39 protein [Pseudomonadota bacterium]